MVGSRAAVGRRSGAVGRSAVGRGLAGGWAQLALLLAPERQQPRGGRATAARAQARRVRPHTLLHMEAGQHGGPGGGGAASAAVGGGGLGTLLRAGAER